MPFKAQKNALKNLTSIVLEALKNKCKVHRNLSLGYNLYAFISLVSVHFQSFLVCIVDKWSVPIFKSLILTVYNIINHHKLFLLYNIILINIIELSIIIIINIFWNAMVNQFISFFDICA